MRYDTVIIGGGLSALLCGIELARNGKKAAIVTTGHSSLHFSSGSFGLYNGAEPLKAVESLTESHPYSKLGEDIEILFDFEIDGWGWGIVGDERLFVEDVKNLTKGLEKILDKQEEKIYIEGRPAKEWAIDGYFFATTVVRNGEKIEFTFKLYDCLEDYIEVTEEKTEDDIKAIIEELMASVRGQ